MPAVCGKCKRAYDASHCPRCITIEEQKSASSAVDFGSIASMIADSLADNASDVIEAIGDLLDGASGDW